jgi:hypothetical protein
MKVDIDQSSVTAVRKILTQLGANINKELAIAVNKTVKQTATAAARKLKDVIPVPVKVLKKAVFAKDKATAASPRSGINLYGGYPIPLKYFGARQMKKGGVSFRQSGPAKGRGTLPNAFIPPRYGNVYQRAGKPRGPLTQQKGPAPGEYASVGVTAAALATAKDKLPKQINERIRFLTVKAKGQLKGNQK